MSSLRVYLALLGLGGLLLVVPTVSAETTAFDPGRAAFTVQFGDAVVTHRIMAVTALPNAPVRVAAGGSSMGGGYRIDAPAETVRSVSDGQWRFSAPSEPGLYPVVVTDTTARDTVRLQVFVLTPWDHDGRKLAGYRIGRYEQHARRGLETYEPPSGFIEVTDANKDVLVAPHFRLEQFLCKQTEATPQFALIRTRLLHRLEGLLAALNARGHDASTLHVMSGYRTPYYNRAIGNTTEYSRHLYGDAADVFVDTDGDRWMDDLTGDGRATEADARYLAALVRDDPTPGDDRFNGGLGIYSAASHRGPFIHVDLRGYRARW
ncbi:hypothetical protein BSZ35_08920 [Salinibacter sp. 10B]|uniref:D-Ala-D-Ala carboxypeptidase family metallohydrolase n=1 Tax=Salinibacter sp. 10B TaxID=1923971 RepID=UPI000CF47F28|nr:D-Ala-D-Ala carboxypeptidase family metallohydrolase [Salinibacter sp. 10B]PQJ34704.1 hypothetical protein BSZ35_08920 [Salinibacter sp. 10B]